MKVAEQRRVWGTQPFPLVLASILLASCCLVTQVRAKQYFMKSNDKEILDYLLHRSNYDKRIRPEHDSVSPMKVNVSVILLSLSSPDESSLKYEVEFLIQQRWVDPRLKHDDAERYPYLSGLHHLDSIWLPDIFFIKHGDFKEPLEPDHLALRIYRNGTVFYLRRRHLILSCTGDLNIFPFDDPFCTFSIESKSYESEDLLLNWTNDTINEGTSLAKSEKLKELNAYLVHNRTGACNTSQSLWRVHGNFSCLQVDLQFTRDDSFYFSTVFIPSIILVTSSFITFWLEWNAVPARVMIGVTTMLNFFTTSNSFRSSLPVVSNLAAMNLWDSVCMFFIYVSLLEFVVVNYVGRKRPKHNMAYMPGENAVIKVLNDGRHRIPQAIHRIGLSLVSGWVTHHSAEEHPFPTAERKRSEGSNEGAVIDPDDLNPTNRNSHELVSCNNCGNSQCSHSNTANNCPNGDETNEVSQVEYTFNKPRSKDPPHPIRVAKSIDVISRVVFPLGYSIFLLYFFAKYKGFKN